MRLVRSLRMPGSIISTSASVELLSCLTFIFRIAAYNNTVGQHTCVALLVPVDPIPYFAVGVTGSFLVLQLGHANRATRRCQLVTSFDRQVKVYQWNPWSTEHRAPVKNLGALLFMECRMNFLYKMGQYWGDDRDYRIQDLGT